MVECWRKYRQLGEEPWPVPHCPNYASNESVRNEHGARKGEASVTSWATIQSGTCLIQRHQPTNIDIKIRGRISTKSIAEQLDISRERVGSIIHEYLDIRKLSAKWVPKCLNTNQKCQRCQSSEQYLEIFRRKLNDCFS